MDEIRGSRMIHEFINITCHGGPENVRGIIATATELDSNDAQYVDIGHHSENCLGNLQRCKDGYTASMFIKFKRLRNNMYFLSTGDQGINIFYKDGELHITFEINGKKWDVPLSQLEENRWYFLEYTWHPDSMLRVYINNQLVGADGADSSVYKPWNSKNHYYIGRPNDGAPSSRNFRYGDFIIDHHLIWFDRRENLIADGIISRGTCP